MSATAKLDVKMTADGSQVKTEVQGVARAVQDAAGRMASAYASVSVQIKSVSAAVSGFQKALGIWAQVATLVSHAVTLTQKAIAVVRDFGKASEEAAESAAKFAERANGTGLDVSLYDAIAEAAKSAGMEADEFSKRLREFKEHKITFDELAASIGTTGDALLDAADAADASTVGRRYLARRKGEADEAKARAEQEKAEREGLREIAAQIVKKGDAFGRGEAAAPYWRMLMEAAGGDIGRAGELFNENVPWYGMRRVGQRMFGEEALRGAAASYAADREAAEAARRAAIAAQDAATEAERKAEAEKAAADAAEKEAAERERLAAAAEKAAMAEERARATAAERAAAAEGKLAAAEEARAEAAMSAAQLAEKRKSQMEAAEGKAAAAEAGLAETIERVGDESDAEVSEAREYLAAAKLAALGARSAYEKAVEAAAAEAEAGIETGEEPAGEAPSARASAPLSDRLRRVGGYVGGPSASFDRAQSERVRHTRLLERIARATETKLDATATLG